MTDQTIRERIRDVVSTSSIVDPHNIAAKLIDSATASDRADWLAEVLPRYVGDVLRNDRNSLISESAVHDEYGVVVNSPETFEALANYLRNRPTILFGWTDNEGSHLDVLLALPDQIGPLNRMDSGSKLIVAVAGYGMFGFRVRGDSPLHFAYLGEKLGMTPSVTAEALADLVNGVMRELTIGLRGGDAA